MRKKYLSMLYVFLKKSFTMLYIVFLVSTAFSVMNVFVAAGPPSSGDWIVTGTESYSNQTIVLDGNLIVESGGNLTFKGVTLKMKCHYDGEYRITVNPGGSFYVLENSIITSASLNKYSFFVWQDSTFRMNDSELHYCGWEGGAGLNIHSDDAVIENSLMSHNFYNVFVHSNGVVIRNNNITANEQGITISGTGKLDISPAIYNNHISWNTFGINFADCSPSIYNNTITLNLNKGINFANATPLIRDNFITNNGDAGIHSYSYSSPMIFNNTIASNLGNGIDSWGDYNSIISENIITSNPNHGIYCHDNSSAIIRNNTITGNSNGIGCENSNPTIQNNTVSSNQNGIAVWNSNSTNGNSLIQYNAIFSNIANGIMVTHSNATIRQNNITANAWGIVLNRSTSSIQGNVITANNEGGIHIEDYSNGTILENIIEKNNQRGIEIGSNSNPTIQGNNISQNSGNGISVYSSNATIRNNTVTNNTWGITCSSYSNPLITENDITSNIEVGITIANHSNPIVLGNQITPQLFSGIVCSGYSNPTIQGNQILKGGIFCFDGSQPEIHWNDIYDGANNSDPTIIVNATYNYWGDPEGPKSIPPNTLYNPWLTEPIVYAEITYPLVGETVSATVTVSTNASATNGIDKVEFYIDDQLEYTDSDSPYEWPWDTTQYNETSHKITVKTYDVFGLKFSAFKTVFVDNTPPTASITEPLSGNTYYGIMTISVNATDNREVSNVRVKVDSGEWLVMTYNKTDSLWKYDFNTTTLYDGQHTIMSLALDKAGNPATTSITVLIDNNPPTLTIQSPTTGMTIGLTLTVNVQANDVSNISRVEFYLHNVLVNTAYTSPYQWAWDTTRYPNGEYTITVKAYDSIGNVKSREVTVTVNNVEVSWWQENFWTIMQVVIALGALMLGVVTYWSRTREKRKRKKTESQLPKR